MAGVPSVWGRGAATAAPGKAQRFEIGVGAGEAGGLAVPVERAVGGGDHDRGAVAADPGHGGSADGGGEGGRDEGIDGVAARGEDVGADFIGGGLATDGAVRMGGRGGGGPEHGGEGEAGGAETRGELNGFAAGEGREVCGVGGGRRGHGVSERSSGGGEPLISANFFGVRARGRVRASPNRRSALAPSAGRSRGYDRSVRSDEARILRDEEKRGDWRRA